MAPQQGIVRDIQHAQNTPEQTYVDVRSEKSGLIQFLGESFEAVTKMAKHIKESNKKDSKNKDTAALAEATSKMHDAFTGGDTDMITSKKDDYLKQYYNWAYKQGYDNSDIDAMIKEYGISDLTEDVTKYRKEMSEQVGAESKMAVEQGYKLDPTARTPQQATAAFNKALLANQVISSKTNQAVALADLDPTYANQTLKSLVPDLADNIRQGFNAYVTQIGGSANLTTQNVMDMEAKYREGLISKGLPEWYATYVTDWAFYPYKNIAKTAGEERAKATTSAEDYMKNLSTAMQSNLISTPMVSETKNGVTKTLTPLQVEVMRSTLGNEGFSTILQHNGGLAKKILDMDFTGDFSNQLMSFTAQNSSAMDAFVNAASPSIQKAINEAAATNIETIPDIVTAAKAAGSTSPLVAFTAYNTATPGTTTESLTTVDVAREKADLPNIINAFAQSEIDTFGKDKLVKIDSLGHAKLYDVVGKSLKETSKDRSFSSEPILNDKNLRYIESTLQKLSKRTQEPISSIAAMHNSAAYAAHGMNVESSKDTRDLFSGKKVPPVPQKKPQMSTAEDYENSKEKKEWDNMSTAEQVAEQNRGEEEPVKAVEEPVAPVEDDQLMMSFNEEKKRSLERTKSLFKR